MIVGCLIAVAGVVGLVLKVVGSKTRKIDDIGRVGLLDGAGYVIDLIVIIAGVAQVIKATG